MTRAIETYGEYKDSRVEWLGNVPAHWDVASLRHRNDQRLGKMLDAKRISGEHLRPYLRNVDVQWDRVNVSGLPRMDISAAELGRYTLEAGDLLVCEGGEVGRSAVWAGEIQVCGYQKALHRLRPHDKGRDLPRFLLHSLRLAASRGAFTDGQKSTIDHLTGETLRRHRFVFPPLAEQTAIVRLLDYLDRRVRRYIQRKEKLIALLEEQKQAVIHQAVTGQIDVRTGQPYPAYNDSGTEWLDGVPTHWCVSELRRLALDRCDGPFGSGLKSSHYTEDGVRVVRLQNIGHAEFRNSDRAYISHRHCSSLGDHSVLARDLLIAGLGDRNHPAGRACVAPEDLGPAIVKADCFRFRLDENRLEPRFATLQLTATAAAASAVLSTGATRQRINLQSTSARPMALPPLNEQRAVVEHIDLQVAGLRRGQDTAERQIALLREFRTRLIADVVTGQLDVRAAAAALPDVEPSPNDCAHGPEPVPDVSASGDPGACTKD